MLCLDREINNSRESDGDRYIKVINAIVSLMTHLYHMKNRLFIQDYALSYHSNIKCNHGMKALTLPKMKSD